MSFISYISGQGLVVEDESVTITLTSGHELTGNLIAMTPHVLRVQRTDEFGDPLKHKVTHAEVETLVNPEQIAAITVMVPEL